MNDADLTLTHTERLLAFLLLKFETKPTPRKLKKNNNKRTAAAAAKINILMFLNGKRRRFEYGSHPSWWGPGLRGRFDSCIIGIITLLHTVYVVVQHL
jgi:hypothetical protein